MKTSIKSIVPKFITTGFAAVLALGSCLPVVRAADQPPVKSKLGYQAVAVEPAEAEEGASDTIIKKDGKEIARIADAIPVSFSPDGTILLLHDAAADDDCRHFLLNVAAGEKPKPFCERNKIGGRHVENAEWSKDGKSITFTNAAGLAEKTMETIMVTESVTTTPAKKP